MSRVHPKLPKHREPCALPHPTSTNSFWHSEPSPLLLGHRSTRRLPDTTDVVIIGSGMTGTSVAYHLFNPTPEGPKDREHGLNVVMLEAREACWGATGRNGGHCQPLLFETPHDPSIGNFELRNFHALQALIADKDIAEAEFVPQPGVRAIYTRHHLEDAEMALAIMKTTAPDLGSMMRLVTDPDELATYRIPTAMGAIVTSIAARMWPYKLVSRVLSDLITSTNLTGTFNLQTLTPAERITRYGDDHWSVETARGSIVAKKVVLATNAYTSHLLPSFADLIVPCRGQMSALKPLPSVTGDDRLKTSLGFLGDGLDDYLIQRPNERGGHLMFGGGRQHGPSVGVTDDSVLDEETAKYLRTRLVEALGLPEGKGEEKGSLEFGGCDYCTAQKLHCSHTDRGESAARPCTNCQRFRQTCTNDTNIHNILAPSTSTSPPPAEFTATHQWTGIMGFSRDERPWVGPVPDHAGIYIAAGFTGHGMPNTWLCGKAAALMAASSWSGGGKGSLEKIQVDEEWIVEQACAAVQLPRAYRCTRERMVEAMKGEDVETKDWAEMERGGHRTEGDRPPSGYA